MQRPGRPQHLVPRRFVLISLVLLVVQSLAGIRSAWAEGSSDMYPNGIVGYRASLEWRTSSYGPGDSAIKRRTLMGVFANAGEFILMGSTAAGVARGSTQGDILIYDPGTVTGPPGDRILPATPSYSCSGQRALTGNLDQGQITRRAQELAGPDTIVDPANATPGNAVPDGYVPCFYQAPVTGLYDVVVHGPSGFSSDLEIATTGEVSLASPHNFGPDQATSVSAWDITVRDSLTSTSNFTGRLFAYYLALFSGDNGRPIFSTIYVVTLDGFRYQTDLKGNDPHGFVLYGNQVGYYDSDGQTPLYHDVLAAETAANPNQLTELQGGVKLGAPAFPIFFNPPDPAALSALGIPVTPTIPTISSFSFSGSISGNSSLVGAGGTFHFTTDVAGVYEIIISHDGVDFDPTHPQNRALRGLQPAGAAAIEWDGSNNIGDPFPAGPNFLARMFVHGGEFHFPLLDAENNVNGGPTYTLLNPPGGVCFLTFGCSTGFYDDRGYVTLGGTLVGTPGEVLCGSDPPPVPYSGPLGYDGQTQQRNYGRATGGNASFPCLGSFGDAKGLDTWTYVPSNMLSTLLNIIQLQSTETPGPAPTSPVVTPTPGATRTPGPTPPPVEIPSAGSGPGPAEMATTALLWILAALAPLAGWQVWRRRKAGR